MSLPLTLLDEFLRLFCPTPCRGCAAPRGPLCPRCHRALTATAPRASPATAARPLWVWLGSYEDPWQRLIRGAKIGRRPGDAARLAAALAEQVAARPGLLAPADALVYPPVDADRRAFHPAVVAAETLGRRAGLPALGDLVTARAGAAAAREGGRDQRAGLARAKLLPGRPPPAGVRKVALVDDLVTTGATAARMTELFRARGLEVVLWLTLAATPRRFAPSTRIAAATPADLSGPEKSPRRRRFPYRPRSRSTRLPSLDGDPSSW